MLKSPILLILLAAGFLSSGCFTTSPHQQPFYVSPFNGNSQTYHPLPLHTDSAPTAVYVGGSAFAGYANDMSTDHLGGANLSLHVAQHKGLWQWHYGLDATAGSYTLGTWKDNTKPSAIFFPIILVYGNKTYPAPLKADELNAMSGSRFFGGLGFSGGFNGVIPMGQGEWRFLGVETSLHQEFGDYRQFREKLPDSLASYNVHQSFFGTAGLSSEWVFRTREGDFGFRFSGGWALGPAYRATGVYDSIAKAPLRYGYGTFSFHYTWNQYTLWYQVESATRASAYRLGFSFRLGQPRLPAKHLRDPGEIRQRPAPPPHPRPWDPFHRSK
jgi:hypothetical protein